MKTEAQVLRELRSVFERHAVTPPGVSLVLALWTMNTYMWRSFEFCPYLFITSPVKRCGKTTLLTLLSHFCNRPLFVSSITSAALSRSIKAKRPTLLFDEAEKLTNEMRTVLNAGFKKGGTVVRCAGSRVEEVEVYGPKAIAAIAKVPETVYDRSIVINMRRKLPGDEIEPPRTRVIAKAAERTRRKIHQWVEAHRKEVVRAYRHLEIESLTDRELDIWQPLFAIASIAAPSGLKRLHRVATKLAREKKQGDTDDSRPLELLNDIRELFRTRFRKTANAKLATEDLLAGLTRERRWNSLTSAELAKAIRAFGVAPRQMWLDGENVRGYRRRDFDNAFGSYLSAEEKR